MKLLALILVLGALSFAAIFVRRYLNRRRVIARLMAWPVAEQHGPALKTAALSNRGTAPLHGGPTTKAAAAGSSITQRGEPRMEKAA